MQYFEAEAFFSRLKQVRVLVVGDLMLDEYLWGKTGRISPEAPVPVVDISNQVLRLGGAGNVINNLQALGCRVSVASVVGRDEDGHELCRILKGQSIDTAGIVLAAERTTTRKTRILASNQQMMRIDRECRSEISPDAEQQLIDYVTSADDDFQVILVSDYLKGVLTDHVLETLLAFGRAKDIPVIVDPKGKVYTKYRGATLLTPNRAEAELASGITIDDEVSCCVPESS